MATRAEIADALRNAHAAGDTEAARKLADAYSVAPIDGVDAATSGPNGVPLPEGVTNGPTATYDQGLGFKQGLTTVGDNLALGAKKLANSGLLPFILPGTGDSVDQAGKMLGMPSTEEAVAAHSKEISDNAANRNYPGKTGRFAGEVLGTLPTALLGPVSGGAAAGALTADPNSGTAEHILNAGIGAGTAGVLGTAGRAIAPHASDSVVRLRDAGVTMTPGQIFGGMAKGVEDRAAGFPVADWFINGAKRGALRDFNTAAGNEALSPMGMGANVIPRGVSGQDMSTAAHDAFDNNYGQILPQISVQLGNTLSSAVNNAGGRVAARLPDAYDGQFNGTLADVFKKMSSGQTQPSNTFPGQAVKDAMTDLGYESRAYGTPNANPNDRALGRAYGDVREGLRSSIASSDPWAAPVLNATDQAYGRFIPVDKAIRKASGNGGGLEAGVFTPQQLRQSVMAGDRSARGVTGSQGNLPLQQLAEDGIQVLPSSIGDSGTAGRLALPAMIAEAVSNPAAAGKAALMAASIPALYSRPGLAATNAMFARQAGPGATALGDLVRNLAAPIGGSAFNAAKGNKRK